MTRSAARPCRGVRIDRRLGIGALVLSSLVATARADIGLEANLDHRASEYERKVLDRFKLALQDHRVFTQPRPILERIGAYVPQPGIADRRITRTTLIERIEKAVSRAAHEAYDEAIAILESVFRDLDANPALAASDPSSSQTWVTKARVGLAYSYARIKNSRRASEVILDHIRSYPHVSLDGVQQEVESLYKRNLVIAEKAPRGRLVFRVDRPDAGIFVNGIARGKGKVDLVLLPGDYRVVVLVSNAYLSYSVTVRAAETHERAIDWSTHIALTTSSDWIGFDGPGPSGRDVIAFAEQLARQHVGEAVIVFGIAPRDGGQELVARRFAAPPAPPRATRAVSVDASDEQLDALAAHVALPDSELADLTKKELALVPATPRNVEPRAAASLQRSEEPTRVSRWPLVAAAGVFSTSLPLGSYLLKTRNNCYDRCSRFSLPAALGLLGVGSFALGFGVYWIVHSERAVPASPTTVHVQPVPGGGVAHVEWAF